MAPERYYVTTPIYYATDEPHIGHAYTTIAADAAARYRRLTGHQVFLLTGTDEHGQKMEKDAARQGITPRELADRTAPRYLELWSRLAIAHDGFVRTTEPRHRDAVRAVWSRMQAKGDVYRGEYEGRYCVSCEAFYLDKELVGGLCPDHRTVPETLKESGYFFRLSAYGERLLEHYRKNPGFVEPESRRNEVVSFVSAGLRDLSISRATTRWGVAVPQDPEQVIYVWVDALTNYLTGVGFPSDAEAFERWWPASVHIVGKDILRFHAVYWPAFLMSAGIELPRQVYGHGWWLRDNQKVSKSRGGAIKVEPLLERFGADAVRYFLLREIPFGLDGSYSDQALVERYNADLANDYGNLAQRTLKLVGRFGGGRISPGPREAPGGLGELVGGAVEGYRRHLDALQFSRGLEAAFELVRAGNRWVDEQAPWQLAKEPGQAARLEEVLYVAAELLRLASVCLHPVMPDKTARVLASLGAPPPPGPADLAWGRLEPGTAIGPFEALFPRVDAEEWLRSEPAPEARAESEAAEPPAEGGAGLLALEEFLRADLRVARVKHAERVKGSRKLLRLEVDVGEGSPRQLVAGIAERYSPQDMIGRSIIVVANLKPAMLMGLESRGMLLAASRDGLPVLAGFDEDIPPGTRVR